jgi:hypothetical protein
MFSSLLGSTFFLFSFFILSSCLLPRVPFLPSKNYSPIPHDERSMDETPLPFFLPAAGLAAVWKMLTTSTTLKPANVFPFLVSWALLPIFS